MAPEFEHEEVIVSVRYMLIEYFKKIVEEMRKHFFFASLLEKKCLIYIWKGAATEKLVFIHKNENGVQTLVYCEETPVDLFTKLNNLAYLQL